MKLKIHNFVTYHEDKNEWFRVLQFQYGTWYNTQYWRILSNNCWSEINNCDNSSLENI